MLKFSYFVKNEKLKPVLFFLTVLFFGFLFIILTGGTAQASTTVIDDFNSYTDGNLAGQGNWTNSTLYQVEGTLTQEGAKAIIHSSGGSYVTKSFTSFTQGTIYAYIRKASGAEGAKTYLELKEGGSVVIYTAFGGGNISYFTGGSYTTYQAGSSDTWYKIGIDIDASGQANKFRFNVNDGTWTGWVASAGNFSVIDGINLEMDSSSNNSYWDNIILITAGAPAPTVTAINPTSADNNGTVSLTSITGTNFVATPTVKLTHAGQSDITCSGVTFSNSTTLTGGSCDITNALADTWSVVITNPDTQTGTLTNGFTINAYSPPPIGQYPAILSTDTGTYSAVTSTAVWGNGNAWRFNISGNFTPVGFRAMPASISATSTLIYELWSGASNTNPISGTLLASGSILPANLTIGTEQNFLFSSAPDLPAGDYWLVLRTSARNNYGANLYVKTGGIENNIFTRAYYDLSTGWNGYGDNKNHSAGVKFDIIGIAPPSISMKFPTNGSTLSDFLNFYTYINPQISINANYDVLMAYGTTTNFGLFDYSPYFTANGNATTTIQIPKSQKLLPNTVYYAQGLLERWVFGIRAIVASTSVFSFQISTSPYIIYPNNTDIAFNGLFGGASTTPISTTTQIIACNPNSAWYEYYPCYIMSWLFVPDTNTLNRFTGIKDALINKVPFGYFSLVANQLSTFGSTTPAFVLELGGIQDEILTPFQIIFTSLLWLTFILYLYSRFKHITL